MSARPRRDSPDDADAELLHGFHPVLEALESGRRTIDRILVAREGGGAGLGRLLRAARAAGIPVRYLPRSALARRVGTSRVHQGVAAVVSPVPYANPDDLARRAAATPTALMVALDGLEDPRNLGAILRTACAVGALGVLLGGESTVGVTAVAAKAAAGAAERIAIAREVRLARRLGELRRAGFRVIGLDPRAPAAWDTVDMGGRLVIVAGGEGAGMRPSTAAECSDRVAIPISGSVESLNVSVAVAVVLFEAVRQRRSGAASS